MTTDAKPIPAHTDCPTCPDCSAPCGTRLDDTALAVDTFLDAGKLRCSHCGHHWEASDADLAQAAAADAAWLRKEAEDAGEEMLESIVDSIMGSQFVACGPDVRRDIVSRIVVRAAVRAAMDICHETGDPETWWELIVETVLEAFGRAVIRHEDPTSLGDQQRIAQLRAKIDRLKLLMRVVADALEQDRGPQAREACRAVVIERLRVAGTES